jgi:long-chain acyl-CoA synthetase
LFYENGARKTKKFSEVYIDVQNAARYLIGKGLKRGTRVGILGKNCYTWVVIDLACLHCGLVTVPLEPTHLTDVDDLIKEYNLSLVATNLKSTFWSSPLIVHFDQVRLVLSMQSPELEVVNWMNDDIFTFNFTSGTSSKPKAVEVKKKSFDHLISGSQNLFGFRSDDRFLVFLPLNVYLERCYIYSAIIIGFDIILISAEHVFRSLQSDSPTVVIGIPYFFENVQKLFVAKVESNVWMNVLLKLHRLLDKVGLAFLLGKPFILFKKLWGGRMRYLLCGSAPIREGVLRFYQSMGIPIYEGYGMNEIAGMITLNHPKAIRIGSVGKPFPGKNVTFDEQNQIIVDSPFHANSRYFNEDDIVNQKTYIDDTRVATGDVGFIDKDGFIFITGRIKDMIILSNGRKIHPTPEETRIEEMLPASNCCIFGDDKPYLTALIVPNGKALSREYIKTKLEEYNSGVPDEKQIKDFFISDEPFSVDNGLLTPAFKLNRKYLYQKYALEFEKLY